MLFFEQRLAERIAAHGPAPAKQPSSPETRPWRRSADSVPGSRESSFPETPSASTNDFFSSWESVLGAVKELSSALSHSLDKPNAQRLESCFRNLSIRKNHPDVEVKQINSLLELDNIPYTEPGSQLYVATKTHPQIPEDSNGSHSAPHQEMIPQNFDRDWLLR